MSKPNVKSFTLPMSQAAGTSEDSVWRLHGCTEVLNLPNWSNFDLSGLLISKCQQCAKLSPKISQLLKTLETADVSEHRMYEQDDFRLLQVVIGWSSGLQVPCQVQI